MKDEARRQSKLWTLPSTSSMFCASGICLMRIWTVQIWTLCIEDSWKSVPRFPGPVEGDRQPYWWLRADQGGNPQYDPSTEQRTSDLRKQAGSGPKKVNFTFQLLLPEIWAWYLVNKSCNLPFTPCPKWKHSCYHHFTTGHRGPLTINYPPEMKLLFNGSWNGLPLWHSSQSIMHQQGRKRLPASC